MLERTYKVAPAEARRAVELVLEAREFHMPGAVATGDWQGWFGRSDCDFSDVIIAHLNRKNGCSKTLTFDRHAAKRVPGMELLS